MAAPKLRLVFYEDNTISSYYYLDKTEGLRIIAILNVLHQTDDWISASSISKMINAKLAATLSTISKMAGAEKIDIQMPEGRKIIARKPFIAVKKGKKHTDTNSNKPKYLKPPIYVKHIRKCKGTDEKDIHEYYSHIRK